MRFFFKLDYFKHIFFLQMGKREQSMQFTEQLCTYCILRVQIASPFFFYKKKLEYILTHVHVS